MEVVLIVLYRAHHKFRGWIYYLNVESVVKVGEKVTAQTCVSTVCVGVHDSGRHLLHVTVAAGEVAHFLVHHSKREVLRIPSDRQKKRYYF